MTPFTTALVAVAWLLIGAVVAGLVVRYRDPDVDWAPMLIVLWPFAPLWFACAAVVTVFVRIAERVAGREFDR